MECPFQGMEIIAGPSVRGRCHAKWTDRQSVSLRAGFELP